MTAWISALVLLLSAVTTFAFHALDNASGAAQGMRARIEQETLLSQRADQVVRRLEEDRTPLADSAYDQVWEYMRALSQSNIGATLEDLSWLPDECPFVDVDIVPVPFLQELFHRRGIDTESSRAVAETIARERRVRCGTGVLHLAGRFGASIDSILPLLTSAPLVNVNLAPEHALRLGLTRQLGSPTTVSRVLADLLSLRQTREIDQGTLGIVLSRAPGIDCRPLRVGVRTWTWRVTLSSGDTVLVRTLARLVEPRGSTFVPIGNRFGYPTSPGSGLRRIGVVHGP